MLLMYSMGADGNQSSSLQKPELCEFAVGLLLTWCRHTPSALWSLFIFREGGRVACHYILHIMCSNSTIAIPRGIKTIIAESFVFCTFTPHILRVHMKAVIQNGAWWCDEVFTKCYRPCPVGYAYFLAFPLLMSDLKRFYIFYYYCTAA